VYNRYIPQGDGSYRRRSMPEQPPRSFSPSPEPPRPEPCPEPPPVCDSCPHREPPRREPPRQPESLGFLRQLLPGNFDAEDLLIVLILLLMSGDSREDGKLPLLTLALYLFL